MTTMNEITKEDQLDKLVEMKINEALLRKKKLNLYGYFKPVISFMTDSSAIAISTYFYFAYILHILNSLLLNLQNILDVRGYDFILFSPYFIIIIIILKTINAKFREHLRFPIYYNILISIVFSLSFIVFNENTVFIDFIFFTTEIGLSVLLTTFVLDYYFNIKNKSQLINNYIQKNKYPIAISNFFILTIIIISFDYLSSLISILDKHPWFFPGLLVIINLYLLYDKLRRDQRHD